MMLMTQEMTELTNTKMPQLLKNLLEKTLILNS